MWLMWLLWFDVSVFGRLLGRPGQIGCVGPGNREMREKKKRNWWDAFEVKGRGWLDVAMDECALLRVECFIQLRVTDAAGLLGVAWGCSGLLQARSERAVTG